MARPADKIVSLAELRFKPANSNDAARAVLAHHFVNVPRCSFARDDGISHYLGSETGMDTFPASPDIGPPDDSDVPAIESEAPRASGGLRQKLLRGGFALSIFLHAVAAVGLGVAALPLLDDAPREEGITSVTFIVEGNADADANAAGAEEEVKAPEETPVETPVKPVEKPVAVEKPVQATTEAILKDVPLPVLGADLPDVLTARTESEVKTEIAAKPLPVEEKVVPVARPVMPIAAEKPVEQKPVVKKPEGLLKPVEKTTEKQNKEPKKEPEKKKKKDKAEEKRRQNRGNQGDQASNARKGDVDSDNKGRSSTNSRGDSSNREIGNAARSNYKGLVNRKLARAKGRVQAPAKGKVTVRFIIMANGSISGLKVTQSSGKAALDAAALKVVRSASPFPAIPAETARKSWPMTVPMTFK